MRTVPSGCSELGGLPALYYFWELFTLQFPGCSLPGFVKFHSIYAGPSSQQRLRRTLMKIFGAFFLCRSSLLSGTLPCIFWLLPSSSFQLRKAVELCLGYASFYPCCLEIVCRQKAMAVVGSPYISLPLGIGPMLPVVQCLKEFIWSPPTPNFLVVYNWRLNLILIIPLCQK